MARPDAAGRAGDDDAALVFGGHGWILTRGGGDDDALFNVRGDGYVLARVAPADLAIPPVCGVSPVTRRTIDAAVETCCAALSGMADYWSAAIVERRTPADVALDGLRWWQLIADRRPPQWASRHCIVRRSPRTRLRDCTPARPADVVPTLVVPPQAGDDSCIVDYSTRQSQVQTILAAGRAWRGPRPGRSVLGAGEGVAERVAGRVLAGARGLQRHRAVGAGRLQRLEHLLLGSRDGARDLRHGGLAVQIARQLDDVLVHA
jgi:hypothetical protein